jgi:hypothetical protein
MYLRVCKKTEQWIRAVSSRVNMSGQAVANHVSTGINHALNQHHIDGVIGLAGAPAQTEGVDMMNSGARAIMGDATSLGTSMNLGRTDIHESAPHATTSLAYAINGTARLFADTVTAWMAGYVEPMKVVMGTIVVEEESVLITREYLVGGGCQITAERSLAPTISLKEDQRRVVLNTYGADITVNNDIFFKKELALRQISMLMTGQRTHLQNKATAIMYKCVMAEATSLIAAYQRASAVSGVKSGRWRQIEANKIYMSQQFGAMNKWPYPMTNLIASLAKANKYTPSAATRSPMNVMIAPAEFLHSKYTRPSEMYYYVSGEPNSKKAPVPVPMPNAMELVEAPSIRVMIHHAPASFGGPGGTANPQVMWNHLAREIATACHYPLDERTFVGAAGGRAEQGWSFGITNFKAAAWGFFNLSIDTVQDNLMRSLFGGTDRGGSGENLLSYDPVNGFTSTRGHLEAATRMCQNAKQGQWVRPASDDDSVERGSSYGMASGGGLPDGQVEVEIALIRPNMVFRTLCAIFSAGTGAEIGAFLVGYPKTMAASTQFVQMTRIGLRIAFGAALFAREKVIVMEDVLLDGVIKGDGCRLSKDTRSFVDAIADEQFAMIHSGKRGHDLFIGMKLASTDWNDIWEDPFWVASQIDGPYSHYLKQRATYKDNRQSDKQPDWPTSSSVEDMHQLRSRMGVAIPVTFPRGTVCDNNGKIKHENNGHLGSFLDQPGQGDNINGRQRVHKESNMLVTQTA